MHDLNEFEAWRQHREELARELAQERLARRLRSGRPRRGLRGGLAGRIRDLMVGGPQAAR